MPLQNHSLLVLAAALALALAPADATTRPPIAIPAGLLGDAIVALGRQSGASVRLSDPALWHLAVRGVRGRLDTRAVLARLLAGSGARPIAIGADAWEIVPRRPRPGLPAPLIPTVAPAADIIVTASKQATPLADYAGSVTILDTGLLAADGPADSAAIESRAASVTSTHLGSGRDKLFIRGIADSGLVGQSQATVGEYLGDIRLSYNAPDPDLRLYDVASVEILEGPQGTLYGAGSPGGIIRIEPNLPDTGRFSGSASGGVSAIAHGDPGGDGAATLNLPIVPGAAALRVVGYGAHDGGYIDEAGGRSNVNAVDTYGGRAALRITPGDGWTIGAGFTAQDIDAADAQYADRDAAPLTRDGTVPQPYDDDYRLAELTVSRTWDHLRLTSSNAWVHQALSERFEASDPGRRPRLLDQQNVTQMFATEDRLSRPLSDGWGWVAGASYVFNEARIARALGPAGAPSPSPGVLNRVEEGVLYGELSAQPLAGVTLTAGGRLTRSAIGGRALDPVLPLMAADFSSTASRTETKLLPSASVSIAPLPGLTLFTRYQQGFRPGGLAVGDGLIHRFASDRVGTGEFGGRYRHEGTHPFSLAASLAYTDWRNIQADFLDGNGLPVTTNIGDGRIWSVDVTAAWVPVRRLRLEASFLFNDGRLTRPDETQLRFYQLATVIAAVNQPLPNVAEFGGRAGFDYSRPIGGGATLSVDGWARYVGRSRLGVGPVLGGMQGDYVDTGLSLRLARGRFGTTLSATNLLGVVGNRFALGTPLDVRGDEITPLQPRTIRLGFDVGF